MSWSIITNFTWIGEREGLIGGERGEKSVSEVHEEVVIKEHIGNGSKRTSTTVPIEPIEGHGVEKVRRGSGVTPAHYAVAVEEAPLLILCCHCAQLPLPVLPFHHYCFCLCMSSFRFQRGRKLTHKRLPL